MSEHYVYSAWDANGQALYVGCTNNVRRRMKEHANVSMSWVPRAVVMTVIPFATQAEALDAEARQIDKLRPLYNTRHNPRFMSVREAERREMWRRDFDDLNGDAAGRARYLERHPDASGSTRRWIAMQDLCDRRRPRRRAS